jgi:hypothetical protein
MIDEGWAEGYGVWDFHRGRFPDPKAMMDEHRALHPRAVDDRSLPVEVHELPERQRVSDEETPRLETPGN